MISIKELTHSTYETFLYYLACNNMSKDFSVDVNRPIWTLFEGEKIRGFLSTTNCEQKFSILEYLITDHDCEFKDGLIRAAINACHNKRIPWIVCRESFLENKFPLKDYFKIVQTNHELYSLLSVYPLHQPNENYYFTNSDIIYKTGCKGRVSSIESKT
ncbi:hypothetical protein SAMN05192551_101196 [Tindallia magadiensis]|uniref:N-acetyltransferase domain-containing protein n=1 Tax=Tindallia magadiensis TaxID=69895 RepID=A0A1I3AIE1_9FIRM|nr:hypothetical protein [Tindallia magadiensis]SFH49101.1 hypothetical protein SAMN05192551_101196 [Tindallia magadiensis]